MSTEVRIESHKTLYKGTQQYDGSPEHRARFREDVLSVLMQTSKLGSLIVQDIVHVCKIEGDLLGGYEHDTEAQTCKPKSSTAFPERGVSSFEGSEDEESDDSAVTVVETEERGKVKTREEVVVQQEIYDNWDNRGPRSLRWSRLNYTVKELVKYGYLKDSDTKNDEVLPFAIQRANEKIETVPCFSKSDEGGLSDDEENLI